MTSPAMHVEDIKAAIRKKGQTIVGLSKEFGYHRSAISKTLRQPWPEVEKRLSEFLGIPVSTLFPARYRQVVSEMEPASNDNDKPAGKRASA